MMTHSDNRETTSFSVGTALFNAGGVARLARHQSGGTFVELVNGHDEFQCAAMMNGMSTGDLIGLIADIAGS